MPNAYVIMKDINKTINKKVILKQCNAELEKGKVHGIVGRNGSGKSMLLKIVSGLVRPTSGTVTVNGQSIGLDINFPRNMGCLIESAGFLPNESGYKNLLYLYRLTHKKTKQDRDFLYALLERVGLREHAEKKVGKYSTGLKQRLGICQALMDNPEFLILDEPMNGLDESGVQDIRSIILGLKKENKTILLTSHIAEDITCLCDTERYMLNGTICMNGDFIPNTSPHTS